MPSTHQHTDTGTLGYFLPALTLAHLFRCAALIRASPSAERRRRPRPDREAALRPTLPWLALNFFHRARCAAAILRRAASDIVRRLVRAEIRLPARRGAVLSPMDSRAAMARSRRSRCSRSCWTIVFMAVIGADSTMYTAGVYSETTAQPDARRHLVALLHERPVCLH